MKIINGSCYLEISEAVEAEIGSENYLAKAKSKGTKCYTFIKDPADLRKALLSYDDLKPEHKAKVQLRFGNPYDLCARQPILNMVQADPAAHDYYFGYTYDKNGITTRLDAGQIAKSTRSAAWLRLVGRVNDKAGWREIREALGLKHIPDFYTHAAALIALEIANGKSETFTGPRQLPGNFPSSYQRLKEKAAAFAEQGLDYCLPAGLGNKMAAKLGKTEEGFDPQREVEQYAAILHVAKAHMNLDAATVNKHVKALFVAKGWNWVGDTRMYQILQGMQELTMPGRRGPKEYSNKMAMQASRKAPDYPTQYWTLDGWTVELLFQEDGKYHNRLDVVIVLDPFNNYPIGYAIGEKESVPLIMNAVRSAICHVHGLTGQYYRPSQLQSDRFQKNALAPFFQAVSGLHTPAAAGNAKAKRIEAYFSYLNQTYCKTQPNWSGVNLTARRESQPNREMIYQIRKQLPDRAGVISQIESIIAREREAKGQAYNNALRAIPADKMLQLEYMGAEWLRTFGSAVGGRNQLTGQGIIKQINGQTFTYNSFDSLFHQQRHIDWQIWADKDDMSRVLAVSPDGKQQYVLHEKRVLPMAAAAHTEEDWRYLTDIRQFNKNRQTEIIQQYTDSYETVQRLLSDTPEIDKESEAVFKLMPIYNGEQKVHLQQAKGLGKRKEPARIESKQDQEWNAVQQQYNESKVNVNKYLNLNND